jgi:hypothetical protein
MRLLFDRDVENTESLARHVERLSVVNLAVTIFLNIGFVTNGILIGFLVFLIVVFYTLSFQQ